MTSIADLQAQVDTMSNVVAQAAAQRLVNQAAVHGDPIFVNAVNDMFSLSAAGQGIPIFFSGQGLNGQSNYQNALDVRDNVLSGNGYIWQDTPLGQYIENSVTTTAEFQGYFPTGARSLAIDYLSAKMPVDAPPGPAIACVAGVMPEDYSAWLEQELPSAGAGSDITSFNAVPINIITAVPATVASKMIEKVYDCTTGEPVPDPEFAAALLGLPVPEPGLDSPALPSLLVGGLAAAAGGLVVGGIRLAGQVTNTASQLAPYAAASATGVLTYFGWSSEDASAASTIPDVSFLDLGGSTADALNSGNYNFSTSISTDDIGNVNQAFSWSQVNGDPLLYANITSPVGPGGPTSLEVIEYNTAQSAEDVDWSSRELNFEEAFGENAGMTLSGKTVNYDDFSVERTLTPGEDPENAASWETTVREVRQQDTRLTSHIELAKPDLISGAQVGAIFGSSLGQLIGGDNVFAQVAAGSALSTVLINVGQSFDLYANGSRVYSDGSSESLSFEEAGGIAFDNIDVEFGAQIRSSGVGFAASFLTAELADEIGLDGRPRVAQKWEPVLGSTTRANNEFGDQLFNYAAQRSSKMRYVGMTRNFGGPEEMIKDLKAKVFPNEEIRYVALSKDGTKEVKVV